MNDREAAMRRFWDTRAREDAAFFVDDRLPYGDVDTEAIASGGAEVLERFSEWLDVSFTSLGTVVEIGCGLGRVTRALAADSVRVVALDVSPQMLERARELNRDLGNVTWLVGDGTTLGGIPDSSAETCFSHVVFQHLPDPAITLGYVREMGRVLKPGGWAAFQVSNDPSVHVPAPDASLYRRIRRGVREALGWPSRDLRRASPYWIGSAVELDAVHQAVVEGGMEINRVTGEGTQFCLIHARRT